MREVVALDLIPQYDETTGKALTSDVSSTSTATSSGEEITTDEWATGATTAATEISVKKGDKVNCWAEITIPANGMDLMSWTADFCMTAKC